MGSFAVSKRFKALRRTCWFPGVKEPKRRNIDNQVSDVIRHEKEVAEAKRQRTKPSKCTAQARSSNSSTKSISAVTEEEARPTVPVSARPRDRCGKDGELISRGSSHAVEGFQRYVGGVVEGHRSDGDLREGYTTGRSELVSTIEGGNESVALLLTLDLSKATQETAASRRLMHSRSNVVDQLKANINRLDNQELSLR